MYTGTSAMPPSSSKCALPLPLDAFAGVGRARGLLEQARLVHGAHRRDAEVHDLQRVLGGGVGVQLLVRPVERLGDHRQVLLLDRARRGDLDGHLVVLAHVAHVEVPHAGSPARARPLLQQLGEGLLLRLGDHAR